jgi:8-oxo-dGTP pyrophosphatase MutT (NUDIX family)
MYTKHEVSAKAVFLNRDGTKVLLLDYGNGIRGLPGGHIEGFETPDQAIRRELEEELGVTDTPLSRFDFARHKDGRIILFYTGILSEDTEFTLDPEEVAAVAWVDLWKVVSGEARVGETYTKYIVKAVEGGQSTRKVPVLNGR